MEVNDLGLFHISSKLLAEFNMKNQNDRKAPSQLYIMDCIRK